ncbi:MAG: hypothetical protein V1644_01810 [Candidatus Micrarchaeota archaeon]
MDNCSEHNFKFVQVNVIVMVYRTAMSLANYNAQRGKFTLRTVPKEDGLVKIQIGFNRDDRNILGSLDSRGYRLMPVDRGAGTRRYFIHPDRPDVYVVAPRVAKFIKVNTRIPIGRATTELAVILANFKREHKVVGPVEIDPRKEQIWEISQKA